MSSSILGLLAAVVALQAPQASVVGIVRSADSGDPIRGVEVTLTDLDRTTVTDASGAYELRNTPAGPQHIGLRRIGYSTRTLHALVPGGGELEINFSLTIDPVRLGAIDVQSRVEVTGVDRAGAPQFSDRSVTQAMLGVHPLLAEPDGFQALVGGEVVMDPEAPTGVHIRGGLSDQTAYVLDGVPVFSPYHAAGIFSAWNPDALEELAVSSAVPSPALPDALSGTIAASTRSPGRVFGGKGAVSSDQARVTVDGPLGAGGYLLSMRSGLPDILAPGAEPEYIRGESGDILAKVEIPGLGGRLNLLSYSSENELRTLAVPETRVQAGQGPGRNQFEWKSSSLGVGWTRQVADRSIRIQAWHASSEAASTWASQKTPLDLGAHRADEGVMIAVGNAGRASQTELGVRLTRSETSYGVDAPQGEGSSFHLGSSTPVAALFGSHSRQFASDCMSRLGLRSPPQQEVPSSPREEGYAGQPSKGLRFRAATVEVTSSLSRSVAASRWPPTLFPLICTWVRGTMRCPWPEATWVC